MTLFLLAFSLLPFFAAPAPLGSTTAVLLASTYLSSSAPVSPPPALLMQEIRSDGRAGVMSPALNPNGPTLVAIFTTWCEPCLEEVPTLNKLHAESQTSALKVVGISVDDAPPGKVIHWARKHRVKYPVYYAGSEVKRSRSLLGDVSNLPTTLLISAKGNVLRRWVGLVPERILRPAIEPLLTGQ
ncbi:MAG: thiol-disulfide isomerase/thioredoxin [Myxococcota bacterium]|jgi:thiol-disulfide isomerase/thioredoxin